ncbi:MAG: hypothetical protein CVU56_04560 [Deltaproteobacteria bacterium HGW-Deltaproteobacteria-14]|nr:MAG: hypothetical protein CVU56_04560 [Deltaproteobacteria bacterium HGW-Deltaproteobacteria-14]
MPFVSFVSRVAAAIAVAAVPVALLWPGARVAREPPFDPVAVPRIARASDLERTEVLLPRGPAAACGADVAIRDALVDPDAVPDRDGEEVTLVNRGAAPIELTAWRLSCGRRRLDLPAWPLGPGEAITLGGDGPLTLRPLRLANAGGELVLTDPCGVVRARLTWGGACPRPPPGWRVEAPGHKGIGPARSLTGGADGGCGQT